MYEEKSPGIIEQLSQMMGFTKNNGVKTFIKKPDYSNQSNPNGYETNRNIFNPVASANAATMPNISSFSNNNVQQANITDPKSVIREGISKYINGDYPTALSYFLRAQSMPGETDPNLKDYIFKAQRMMAALKEKGINL